MVEGRHRQEEQRGGNERRQDKIYGDKKGKKRTEARKSGVTGQRAVKSV